MIRGVSITIYRAINVGCLEAHVLRNRRQALNSACSTQNSGLIQRQFFVPLQLGSYPLVVIYDALHSLWVRSFASNRHDGTTRLQVFYHPSYAGVLGGQSSDQPPERGDSVCKVRNLDTPAEFKCKSVFLPFWASADPTYAEPTGLTNLYHKR